MKVKFEQLIHTHTNEYVNFKSNKLTSELVGLFTKKLPEYEIVSPSPYFFQFPLNDLMLVLGYAEKSYFTHYQIIFLNRKDYEKYNLHPKQFENTFITYKQFEKTYFSSHIDKKVINDEIRIPSAEIDLQRIDTTYFCNKIENLDRKSVITYLAEFFSSLLIKDSYGLIVGVDTKVKSKQLLYSTLDLLPSKLRAQTSFWVGTIPNKNYNQKNHLIIDINNEYPNYTMLSQRKNVPSYIQKFASELYDASSLRNGLKEHHDKFNRMADCLEVLNENNLNVIIKGYLNEINIDEILYEKLNYFYQNDRFQEAKKLIDNACQLQFTNKDIEALKKDIELDLKLESYILQKDFNNIISLLLTGNSQLFYKRLSLVGEKLGDMDISNIFIALPDYRLTQIDGLRYPKLYLIYKKFFLTKIYEQLKKIDIVTIKDNINILDNLFKRKLQDDLVIGSMGLIIKKLEALINTCDIRADISALYKNRENSILYIILEWIEKLLEKIDAFYLKGDSLKKLTDDMKALVGQFVEKFVMSLSVQKKRECIEIRYTPIKKLFYAINNGNDRSLIPKLIFLCKKLGMPEEHKQLQKFFQELFDEYLTTLDSDTV